MTRKYCFWSTRFFHHGRGWGKWHLHTSSLLLLSWHNRPDLPFHQQGTLVAYRWLQLSLHLEVWLLRVLWLLTQFGIKKKLCLKQIIFFFFSFLKANFQMIRYCLWEEHFQKFLSPPTKSFISILLTLSLSILGKSIIKSKNFFMWLISSFRTSEWCFMLMWLHMCMEEMGHWNF